VPQPQLSPLLNDAPINEIVSIILFLMLESIKKLFIFTLSFILIADSFLPANEFHYKIDRHRITDEGLFAKNYQLMLINGPVKSCSVGYSAYTAVKDGDSVIVKSSRIFRACWVINFDGQVIYRESYGRLLLFILGLGAFAVACGWKNSEDD